MKQRSAARKFADFVLDDGQTLFITAKGPVRYAIALTLAATAVYLLNFVPHFSPNYAAAYVLLAGVYAWEVSAGLAFAFAIFALLKFLGALPFLFALALIAIVLAAFGI